MLRKKVSNSTYPSGISSLTEICPDTTVLHPHGYSHNNPHAKLIPNSSQKWGDDVFLVKKGQTNLDDEKSNPSYIAYQETEDSGIIYIAFL